MSILLNAIPTTFDEKASWFLTYIYDNGGREYKSFRFIAVSDYSKAHAGNAAEFEAIIEHAEGMSWLKWSKQDTISGGRKVYHDVQLTQLGMEKIRQDSPMLFDDLLTCPLTGLPIKGRENFSPLDGSKQALYAFKPIGSAIFERNHLLMIAQSIAAGNHKFRPDLAGLCRQAAERGQPPILLTANTFSQPLTGPSSKQEKRTHLLHFLYEGGGSDYIERDISINNDFPLAFASDAKEFSTLLKSLLNQGLIKYNKPNDSDNDWPYGLRTDYAGVLLTDKGIKEVKNSFNKSVATSDGQNINNALPIPSLAIFHPIIQQVAGSRFSTGHYTDAILAACTALDKAVQAKAQRPDLNGKQLMDVTFTPKNPVLRLSSQDNEQTGFMLLYQGVMQAIRNHYAHNDSAVDPARALEWLGFISALFYKLDEATPASLTTAATP